VSWSDALHYQDVCPPLAAKRSDTRFGGEVVSCAISAGVMFAYSVKMAALRSGTVVG